MAGSGVLASVETSAGAHASSTGNDLSLRAANAIEFEFRDTYLFARVSGLTVTVAAAIGCWRQIGAECRRVGAARVLVENALRQQLSVTDRFEVSQSIPRLFDLREVRIALLDQRQLNFEQERFGEDVAVNRGAWLRVFDDLSAAIDWLNSKVAFRGVAPRGTYRGM